MSDIWHGTYAATPASIRMVGSIPCTFLSERMVFGKDQRGIFCAAFGTPLGWVGAPTDPRPSDCAQLAAEVARELRKIHGIRALVQGKEGVSIGGYYYHIASKEYWTQLGPRTIAAEIKKLECARAMQDAGDM